MNRHIIVLSIACFITLLFAQAPDTLWTRTYGGNQTDFGYSVCQTFDGGYIISGWTASYGQGCNVYVIKTDSIGDTLWTRAYPGDGGYSVIETSDSLYVVAGMYWFGNYGWPHLMKINQNGDTLWTRQYMCGEIAHSVQQTADGGYIITGRTEEYDIFLLKTDSAGNDLWVKYYGGPIYEDAYSVQVVGDTGYIIAGWTRSYGAGNDDVYVIRTNDQGDTLWTRTYGGADLDRAYSATLTNDNAYAVAGCTDSYAWSTELYLLKIDFTGDTVWTKLLGGASTDIGWSIQQTNDNGFIIAGYTHSYGLDNNFYVIKVDAEGDEEWMKALGNGGGLSRAKSVQQTTDGGYIVTGTISPNACDVLLMRIAPDTFGIKEQEITPKKKDYYSATIFSGPLLLPEGKNCRVFDITGRVVVPDKIKPGIYFIEIDGVISHKVIKIK